MLEQLKQILWQRRWVVITAPSVTLLILLIRSTGWLQGVELSMLDTFFRFRPQEKPDDRIVIVGIDEADIRKYGHPINDAQLGDLIQTIHQAKPRAIALDIVRDLPVAPPYPVIVQALQELPIVPNTGDLKSSNRQAGNNSTSGEISDKTQSGEGEGTAKQSTDNGSHSGSKLTAEQEPNYQKLQEIYRKTPILFGITKVTGVTDRDRISAPPTLKELGQISANDLNRDIDSKLRRGFLYLNHNITRDLYLSLGFQMAMLYLEPEGFLPNTDKQDNVIFENADKTKITTFYPVNKNDGAYIRNDTSGYQILLNYRGPANTFKIVPLDDVFQKRIDPQIFHDRIVFIGYTAQSLRDFFDTPYTNLKSDLSNVSGVEVHANVTSHIISSVLDGRPQLRSLPEWTDWLFIFLVTSLGAMLTWAQRYDQISIRVLPHLGLIVIITGGAYWAFLSGWWIPVFPVILGEVLATTVITGYVARSAADIRQAFSRYLTDEVVATLLETPGGLTMGGERRTITILVSDVRGFTGLSERLPPEQVVAVLNIYLDAMADVIVSYQGTIDEFMGDGILVLFGAPTQRPDDPERAIACAIAMQQAMTDVNRQMIDRGLPSLEMGIGINTGEVVVGNIGSLKRTKYGVVGSQVNLTYRIEGYTVGGQILITEATRHLLGDRLEIEGQQQVSPKGVIEPLTIYSVAGIGHPYNLCLRKSEETFSALEPPIDLVYATIQGKDISTDRHPGQLLRLSEKHAELLTNGTIAPMTNLQVQFQLEAQATAEFYAKVLSSTSHTTGNTTEVSIGNTAENTTDSKTNSATYLHRIRLTSVPMEVRRYFQQRSAVNSVDASAPIVPPSSNPS